MAKTNSLLQDLFDHNDWANEKLFALCQTLSDEQLDHPRDMGFGSLRNTIFHNLEAEKLWLERWLGQPWRPLEADASGRSVDEITEEARSIRFNRNELLTQEAESDFARIVDFQDSMREAYSFPIGPLMLHVANHGIHHRAQALSFLKHFGVQVSGGLDYLFWKIAYSSCEFPEESAAPLTEYGLEVMTGEGTVPAFEPERLKSYFAYNDWAMDRVWQAVTELPEEKADTEFDMGMGSVRKSLQHMIDAERWWLANWETEKSPFPRGEKPRTLTEMQQLLADIRSQRSAFVAQLDENSAKRVVHVTAGGPVSCFRVTESLLQLCGHGTHHRAQCLNMLRQMGAKPPALDLIVMLRDQAS